VTVEMPTMPDDQPTRRFRLRFSLKQLFLLVALVGVGFGAWHRLTRKVVEVKAPSAEDRVFGDESLKSRRNVAVVTGRFMKGTSLFVKLYLVQTGVVVEGYAHFVGRDKEEKGGPIWESVTLRLGLGEYPLKGGQRTDLLITGEIPGGSMTSHWNHMTHNIAAVAKQSVPGTITPGRPHIVYVEGDRQLVVDGSMTLEEFAKANPGNYLVVTVEVR
jgi:hypothetical protein